MFALERQKKILELLKTDGAVWVSKLAVALDVTEETVRRDLEKLEKQSSLKRTHGGAVPADEGTYELSLEIRKHTNVEAKKKLAGIALKFVDPGDTIFLDASTTTFFMAKEIKNMHNVTVITNSLRIIAELEGAENIKVIAIGGIVSQNQSFVGSNAENSISENYFASKMFFSSKGIEENIGLMESNEGECGIKRKMIKNSTKHFYICDKSKIGKIGFEKLADFDTVDYFITDAELDKSLKNKFDELGIEIIKED
ncbi:MAG: DeoR/GlpR transcriptional regulator [Clostridia bacterium]|nr:DeoR/GlpR transcriptional regulator [Clostridia bacterium]MBQ9997731.1 DeoR/GlpR transcriptional regulator [Clostridia bacterium]